jgi:hypothetical protein
MITPSVHLEKEAHQLAVKCDYAIHSTSAFVAMHGTPTEQLWLSNLLHRGCAVFFGT